MERLNDAFNNWNSGWGGFFQALYGYFGLSTTTEDPPEWLTSRSSVELDYIYHSTVSGKKPISGLIENFVDDDGHLNYQDSMRIAGMFWTMFGDYCKKEYAVLSLEYDPIKNYAMSESGTDTHARTKSSTHSGSETIEKRGNEVNSKTGTDTLTRAGKIQTETKDSVYGFDSSSGVNSDDSTTTQTFNVDNIPYTETRSPNTTDTRTPNLVDTRRPNLSDSEAENITDTHSFEKSGNIGVTLAQRMIDAEIKLWQWNFFYKFLFPCVDRVLTLPIY